MSSHTPHILPIQVDPSPNPHQVVFPSELLIAAGSFGVLVPSAGTFTGHTVRMQSTIILGISERSTSFAGKISYSTDLGSQWWNHASSMIAKRSQCLSPQVTHKTQVSWRYIYTHTHAHIHASMRNTLFGMESN